MKLYIQLNHHDCLLEHLRSSQRSSHMRRTQAEYIPACGEASMSSDLSACLKLFAGTDFIKDDARFT